jgi:hypothetical protein
MHTSHVLLARCLATHEHLQLVGCMLGAGGNENALLTYLHGLGITQAPRR